MHDAISSEDLSELGKLPKDYAKRLKNTNVPAHLTELLVKVATALLQKINASQDEISTFVGKIDERGASEMLALENYNVQETRREAREEERRRFIPAIKALIDKGSTITEVADILNMSESDVVGMLPELA